MVYKLSDTKKAARIFGQWEEALIWSCVQGVMGAIYTDDVKNPSAALAVLGDFSFFAGKPSKELLLYKPENCEKDFMIMVPWDDAWGELIEQCYKGKAKKVSRYAIKKEPQVFDIEKLRQILCSLPYGYELKMIDKSVYNKCMENEWSKDLVSQYKDYEAYESLGLGAVIMQDDRIISGASSYASYKEGIEIEIDTHKAYRRKGFASICGAKLILECLKRDLYPSWDAQNMWSVKLAEKLGYHYSHKYTAYEIWEY